MRIGGRLVIAGATLWLPNGAEAAGDAVTRGRIDADTAEELGYAQLPVSTLAGPELAVRAGSRALQASSTDGAEVGLLVHAFSYYQGYDFFSPAHFVAEQLGARAAVPVGVQQMCNGGAAAVTLAAAQLLAVPGTAVITTGDRFGEPGFDRWRGDYGVAYGDAGTALVLRPADDPRGGELALLSITSAAAAEFEAMHRAGDPFAPAARYLQSTVDTRRSKKAFLRANGNEGFVKAEREKLREVIGTALAEAGIAPDDPALRQIVLPRLAHAVLEDTYRPLLAEITPAVPVDLGRYTGHLGAGDLLAGAAALSLEPGEAAAVLSAGAGFTWSCAVVRALGAQPTAKGPRV